MSSRLRPRLLVGIFGAGAAATYLFLPDKTRHAPTVDDASLSPSHFTRATLTSSEQSGPNTKLLVLTVPEFSKSKHASKLGPIWSVYIKDDDIQVERPYTPLEGIDEDGRMRFWIKKYPKGEVGRWLHSKKIGDQVEFRGPLSTWAWKENEWDEIVMVNFNCLTWRRVLSDAWVSRYLVERELRRSTNFCILPSPKGMTRKHDLHCCIHHQPHLNCPRQRYSVPSANMQQHTQKNSHYIFS